MDKKHIVLGAGPLGFAVYEELVIQGKNALLVSRNKHHFMTSDINVVFADVTDENELSRLFNHTEVVYHCIGGPYEQWKTTLPQIMKNIINTAAIHQCKVVYADNLYAYGPQNTPLHERLPYKPIGNKTKLRADVATMLMEAHEQRKISATIGRAADFFGPYVKQSTLGERVFAHLLQNKPVELIGNIDIPHSHIYIKDFARALVILGHHSSADGHIWHVPHLPATTTRSLVEQIGSKLTKSPKYRMATPTLVHVLGLVQPFMRQYKELLYQTTQPFTVESDKFSNQYSFTCTPYEEAIDETIQWYKTYYSL